MVRTPGRQQCDQEARRELKKSSQRCSSVVIVVILSKAMLRIEDPAPSVAEGIWATRASHRAASIKKAAI
jgi:hypothetical protein